MDDDPSRRGRDDAAHERAEVDALLHAWALDAVDDAERARVERAVREDPELAAEARALRETAALLAEGGAIAPPEGMRARVLGAVARTPQERRAGPDEGPGTDVDGAGAAGGLGGAAADGVGGTVDSLGRVGKPAEAVDEVGAARRSRRWPRVLVAAAAVLAIAVTGTVAVQQYRRAEETQQEIAAIHDLLARPGSELVVAEVAGGGTAAAVLGDGEAVFVAGGLPELGEDRDYQLWVIDAAGAESAGVLTAHDGRARAELPQLAGGDVLGVTVEPAGGSDGPTSDPIVTLAGG
ncbi:anti-sigma factor domain-containing protein [Georgenia sp. Z1491]|uniref:anti-sigma factor n=1 Tax=Georgenia sp. Z1491 TaxID=3416707 RepID=UPI003CEB88C3